MAAPESFEDLNAWKSARELSRLVYALCRSGNLARDFGLCDQLRRASVSVMNNVAEGWENLHVAEKKQLYNHARRSCGEVRSMSYVLSDNQYISPSQQHDLLKHCLNSGRLISGLIRSLDERP